MDVYDHSTLSMKRKKHGTARRAEDLPFPRCKKFKEAENPVPSSSASPTATRTVALASDSFKGANSTAAETHPVSARAGDREEGMIGKEFVL